eukprot:TRINITY_DN3382_c0_g2_i1.p1 TRINITY_DN3382_c0_g2~~TRINITY_DN3382_c0_g2_i1.p1  ORF type:complete len:803 (-),score=226.48 TRINITY_DN3382_c0_g2_i1:643-3051(-)
MKSKPLEDSSRPVSCSIWGLNTCGQLLGDNEQVVKQPVVLQCSKGIFNFASGDFHTLLITDNLKLFAAGLNIYGQLGVATKEDAVSGPSEVSALAGQTIGMASCGSCYSFAVTTEGTVYSWGLNLKGQLGLGHCENVEEPTFVGTLSSELSKAQPATGMKTQRQITRNNPLLRKGTTQQINENEETPQVILSQRSLSSEKKNFSQSMESKKSLKPETAEGDLITLGAREKVVEVACGSLHTLLRTNCRRVLSAGYGELYALGNQSSESRSIFRPVSFFTEQNLAVIKIACGANGSACVTQEGTTYIWGVINYLAEKPIIFKTPSKFPFEVPEPETKVSVHRSAKNKGLLAYSSQNRAADIKMGDGFTLLLTEKGALYSYGANGYGQLGLGDFKSHDFAEKVPLSNVAQIMCGNDHCLAIDNGHQLYSWGSNSYGQLGDDSLGDKACSPHKVRAFEGVEVFRISCGSYSNFCLSYGKPLSKPEKGSRHEEQMKKEIKELQNEIAKLRLELALKSELKTQMVPKTKSGKGNDKLSGWRPFLEIDVKDLVYIEKITEGGYGIVYLGKWHETQVAIKEIKSEYVTQDKLDEFLTECSTMELVRHPNIVLFMGACTKPPKISIVLEYCEMGSLWTLLHFTKTELPWKLRKQIALDIARSVNYLHCFPTPLLHRDLKSLNVLLDNNLTAKLADFGWARMKETVMTGRIGTYQWMAPEVIASSHYTEKADVFSFGIIMWEMAARKPPYYGIDVSEVAHRVVKQNYRPPIKDGDAPYSWISLMKRCWQKDYTKRPSFAQIIHELEGIKEY